MCFTSWNNRWHNRSFLRCFLQLIWTTKISTTTKLEALPVHVYITIKMTQMVKNTFHTYMYFWNRTSWCISFCICEHFALTFVSWGQEGLTQWALFSSSSKWSHIHLLRSGVSLSFSLSVCFFFVCLFVFLFPCLFVCLFNRLLGHCLAAASEATLTCMDIKHLLPPFPFLYLFLSLLVCL